MSCTPAPRPFLTLVCGYRGHGKDTLAALLTKWKYERAQFNFVFLGKPGAQAPLITIDAKRSESLAWGAFASSLKQGTLLELGVHADWHELEPVKNTLHIYPSDDARFTDNRDPAYLLCNLYTAHGDKMRAIDKDVWCAKALDCLPRRGWSMIVSDFSLLNELDYATRVISPTHDVQTIRVFRAAACCSACREELDSFQTDYLALPSLDDLPAALARFPQYAGYVPCKLKQNELYCM